MKTGMPVTYTPTLEEQPMAHEQPQAALITGWDIETEKATLAVFPEGAPYILVKKGALEGTVPGTFQQSSTVGGNGGVSGQKAQSSSAHK